MTDPGSIVGTISLTLQVLQGLKWYYSQFSAHGDDIRAVIVRVERVESILHVLGKPVRESWRDDDKLSEEVQKCIATCAEAVHRLQTYQQKCAAPDHAPDTVRKRIVLGTTKFLYPFRKDTLEDLQKQLDRLLENLQVIIQALQLDSSIRSHNSTETKTTAICDGVAVVHRRQTYQTELLEAIDQKTEEQWTKLSRHESRVEEKLNDLMTAVSQLLQPPNLLPTPTELKGPCDQYMEVLKTAGRKGRERTVVTTGTESANKRRGLSFFGCVCPNPTRRRSQTSPQPWITFFRTETQRHLPNCPFMIPSQRSVTVGFRMRACRGALGYLIEASLEWANRSLSPHLSYRNIVPWGPAFELISCLHIFSASVSDRYGLLSSAFKLAFEALVHLFKENRADPHDTTDWGETISHYLFLALGACISSTNLWDARIICETIQLLLQFSWAMGFELDRMDVEGRTPLDTFLQQLETVDEFTLSSVFDDLSHVSGLRNLEYSSVAVDHYRNAQTYYKVYAAYVSKDAFIDACNDSPIRKSSLRKSTDELRIALQKYKCRDPRERPDFDLLAASIWTPGLQDLLEHGLDFTQRDKYGDSLLDWVIGFRNMESFHTLIPVSALLTQRTWLEACLSKDLDIINAVALALNRKFRQDYPDYSPSQISQAFAQDSMYCDLFHIKDFLDDYGMPGSTGFRAIQALFEAGFEEVDVNVPNIGTPLWLSARGFLDKDYIGLILWLIKKGARITWQHPISKTMPLHLIAERIALRSQIDQRGRLVAQEQSYLQLVVLADSSTLNIGSGISVQSNVEPSSNSSATNDFSKAVAADFDDPSASFLLQALINIIFQDPRTDHCSCHCSIDGCSVTSASLKTILHYGYTSSVNQEAPIGHLLRVSIRTVLGFYPCTADHPRLFGSVLRAITFHALDLTHTCHDHGHSADYSFYGDPLLDEDIADPLPDEDIADIQYAEREDIKLLEELLLEFESVWEAYDGTFIEFLDGPWSMRVEEVLTERKVSLGDEVEKLADLGVVWSGVGPELPPLVKEEAKHGSWEWFERRVKEIRDGT